MPRNPASYTWDEGPRQYRDSSGRFVARTEVRASLDRYVDKTNDRIREITQELVDQNRTIQSWQAEMEKLIKKTHTAATAIAKGGWEQANSKDWGSTGAVIRDEYRYLARFARQLEEGRPVNGGTIARAEMYGLAATGTYEAILREYDIQAGFDEEARRLHSFESCPECLEYAARGWRPAGELPGIGEGSSCLSRCRCTFARRRSQASKDRKKGLLMSLYPRWVGRLSAKLKEGK
jgi:hypothetical protein